MKVQKATKSKVSLLVHSTVFNPTYFKTHSDNNLVPSVPFSTTEKNIANPSMWHYTLGTSLIVYAAIQGRTDTNQKKMADELTQLQENMPDNWNGSSAVIRN
jgi:hypothetical protein